MCILQFVSVPSILPADGVTILWMLRKGDVDSNQGRAVLQHDTTSNYSYPTGKTKTGNGERQREGEMTGLQ